MTSCINCALKHVGKAKIKLIEAHSGYPWHFWDALAQLSEAEDEVVCEIPVVAEEIRKVRKELEIYPLTVVEFDRLYMMLDSAGNLGTEQVFNQEEGHNEETK